MRIIKILITFLVCALAIVGFVSCENEDGLPADGSVSCEGELVLPARIMHAGGETPDGLRGTNSIEAMNASYEKGEYWLEIDFCPTSDMRFVCLHDFYAYYSKSTTGVEIPDFETFEKIRKTTYSYESPTLDSLILWLDSHPKATIVTDVKENNLEFARTVAESYPDYVRRFAVQIYGRDEYAEVVSLGFDKVIYTLYRQPLERYDAELMREFVAQSEKLVALTYAADVENTDAIAKIVEIGLPVYIHTVNSADEQKFWRELGAYGFYTDCAIAK